MHNITDKPHTLQRTGFPPLNFIGHVIGEGSTRKEHNSTRWTEVTIYVTKGGNYITRVSNRTQWDGETDWSTAASWKTPAEIIEYLRGADDRLGKASQEACEQAAGQDPAWGDAWQETVD